jgi:hypothetical protein
LSSDKLKLVDTVSVTKVISPGLGRLVVALILGMAYNARPSLKPISANRRPLLALPYETIHVFSISLDFSSTTKAGSKPVQWVPKNQPATLPATAGYQQKSWHAKIPRSSATDKLGA